MNPLLELRMYTVCVRACTVCGEDLSELTIG